MSLESYHNTYYSSIELYNTTVTIGHRKGWSRVPTYNYTEPIGLSKFVSIGLRINGNSIQPLVNEWVGGGFDHGTKVSDQSWIVKIYSGENYIVSLHICDEVGGSFPAYGLNQSYGSNILLPVGSYLTVFAVFVGGTTGDQDIWIGFQQDAEKWYRSVPMKTNEEFSVFVTNSTEGWLLATSFLGVNQDTAVVARNNKEQFIDVKVSNNCYIRRIVAALALEENAGLVDARLTPPDTGVDDRRMEFRYPNSYAKAACAMPYKEQFPLLTQREEKLIPPKQDGGMKQQQDGLTAKRNQL
ncbi:uncharacterized protein LOC144163859 [Haemaphysalis longicornis]